jgi:preprotein translocase subunit SecB
MVSNPEAASTATGYVLHRVYAAEISYNLVDVLAEGSVPEDEASLAVRWDWRVLEGREFEVLLAARVEATKAQPHRVAAVIVGVFEAQGSHTTVGFKDFVRRNAAAILFPYVREVISSVSRRGPIAAIELPPLNIAAMAESYSFEATTGAEQIASDPTTRESLGLSD